MNSPGTTYATWPESYVSHFGLVGDHHLGLHMVLRLNPTEGR